MGRVLGYVLLSSALLTFSFAQSSNNASNQQGTTVVMEPTPAIDAARILAPPNAARPGSGTPTGAPPQLGVNDSRSNGGGAVIQPNGSPSYTGFSSPPLVISTPSVSPDNIGGTQNLPTAPEANNSNANGAHSP